MVDEGSMLPVFRRNESHFKVALPEVLNIFGIEKLHDEQKNAIEAFFLGNDVFVSLPTGFGKSLIYQSLPVIASLLYKKPSTIFVISPLRALMEDQVAYLNGLASSAVRAVALTEHMDEHLIEQVMAGDYTHVFGSPECILATESWRQLFESHFKHQLIGVAVDEAHCISHCGLSDGKKAAFREWFGNMGEIRSLIPETAKFVVITATATRATRNTIFEILQLGKDTICIEKSPERANLRYNVSYVPVTMPFEQIFGDVIEKLKESGKNTERTMIYCQTRKQATIIFRTVEKFLAEKLYYGERKPQNRIVELYHAGTPASVKQHIVNNLCSDGHIRCLITTVAFGMGIDCKKVRNIYHMGPSKNVECYVQESGRGGRDGMPAFCVLLYNGVLLRNCKQDIKEYCKTEECRRNFLYAPFDVKPKKVVPRHEFCDNCEKECKCGLEGCKKTYAVVFAENVGLSPNISTLTRPVSREQKECLVRKLRVYRRDKVNKHRNNIANLVSCPNVLLELGDFLIDQVVDNFHRIFSMQDVISYVEVWRHEHAAAILRIISECFEDIEMISDLDIEMSGDDSFVDMEWQQVLDDSTSMDATYNLQDDDTFSGSTMLVSYDLTTDGTCLNSTCSSLLKDIADHLP